jgi:hypothetical protein
MHATHAITYCRPVAVAATAIVTVRFAPQFAFWRGLSVADDMPIALAEFSPACPTLVQANDPFAPVANKHHILIAWRPLFPLTWYTLKLPAEPTATLPCVL